MMANNEIGVIQPMEEIGEVCRAKNVFFHTDAAQAFGKISIDVDSMGVSLMSISSHKIYGPMGAGDCLVINPDTCIDCGVCVPECPIGAIVDDGTHIDGKTVESILSCKDTSLLTKDQSNLLKMANFNKERSQKCPTAIAGEPMKNADEWAEREDKINFIQSGEVKN